MAQSILSKQQSQSTWENFCEWVTSTNNRLYVGWFGVLMIPTLLAGPLSASSLRSSQHPPSISTVSVNPLLVHSCTETTSSLVQLFLLLTQSDFTSIPFGLLHWMNELLQRWSFPARSLPLPHRHLCLHGS